MLETGAPIIPVFYDVCPADLRWIEKGAFASAFARHEKKGRFALQTICAWKSALIKISYVSGLHLHDPNKLNGNQGELLKSLENTVFQYLKPVQLEVAQDCVGLDEAIQDFEGFMESEQQSEDDEVKIVGIVGLGGTGKTTLATKFYNRKCSSFAASSFLFNVRHESSRNALPSLQSKLLKDLLHIKDCRIDNVIEGKGIIRERLQSSTPRVLIVLDDIDRPNQVEALLVKDVLGPRSLIIITSRDEGALRLSETYLNYKTLIYKIKLLGPNHAQELFCRYAFQKSHPVIGFENLVEKFCEKCGGLPLFLKVMGAHLRVTANNNKEHWEDELEDIPDDIRSMLHVSYKALHKMDKQIFLDIACFFVGEHKSLVTKVLDGSEGKGLRHLQNLKNKCLVEFDAENRIEMHDHLRDFGREIADKKSPCRVWNEDQMANSREQRKDKKEYRGIMAAATTYSYEEYEGDQGGRAYDIISACRSSYQPPLEDIELSALKFLLVKGDCFDEQIGIRSSNLVLLRWFDCPRTHISPWLISMKNLRVLELLGGDLETWPLFDKQVPLRELRIRGTNLSEISIPQNIYPCLEHLDLHSSKRLTEVKHLPRKLATLNLNYCGALERIFGSFELTNLQDLYIYRCSNLPELQNLQHLTSFETLEASECTKLRNIQGLKHLLKLRYLYISWCSEFSELPDLQHLCSLETIDAYDCSKLQNIQGLKHLSKLRYLDISNCSSLSELPNLRHLNCLEMLHATECNRLQNIQGLEHLSKLRYLCISGCSELLELPNLQHLSSLETLDASDCSKLHNVQGIQHLAKLQHLAITGCSELQELPNLAHLLSLNKLKADGCWKLHGIQGLDQLEELELLTLSADDNRGVWNSIQQMKKLPSTMCLSWRAELYPVFFQYGSVMDLDIIPSENGDENDDDEDDYGEDDNESDDDEDDYEEDDKHWTLKLLEWTGNNSWSSALICFVVQSSTAVSAPHMIDVEVSHPSIESSVRVKQGEWVCALVVSGDYDTVKSLNTARLHVTISSAKEIEIKKKGGILVDREEKVSEIVKKSFPITM